MSSSPLVRLAHLVVAAEHLERYRIALREEIEASRRLEPGVLTLYAVSAQDDPTRFTILEIYASDDAYQAHLRTPHFLRYKQQTSGMVTSLRLEPSEPLMPGSRP